MRHHPAYYVRFYGTLFAKHLRIQAEGKSLLAREIIYSFAGALEGVFSEMDENARKALGLKSPS